VKAAPVAMNVLRRIRAQSGSRRTGVFDLRRFAIAVLVYGLVAATGLAVAAFSQSVRSLHVELESAQRSQDELLAEYSRLLIERSMLASYHNVDQVAEGKLAMTFPETVERVR